MELFLYIGSILSMAILPLLSEINEDFRSAESRQDSESVAVPDTSRNNLLIKVSSFYLDIMPPSTGVQFYKDGIIFLAPTKTTNRMVPRHVSFGTIDVYVAIPGDSTLGTKYLFLPSSSFSYPCDALTFSKDYKIMYFTRSSKTSGKEQIYQASISSGSNTQLSWSEKNEPLTFCNDGFNYSHPALSVEGDYMIFASDRKGSVGGMDLFISKKEGDSWSAPQNMGNEINTKGNELFPFLDLYNNLYFSSDGLPGLGGYDIYTSKFNGKSWEKPFNLTGLINSGGDEMAFTMSKNDGKTGFYSSRQKSGKMLAQLYKVTLNSSYKIESLKNLSDVFYKRILQIPLLTARKSEDSTKLFNKIVAENKKDIKPVEIPVKAETAPKPQIKPAEPKVAATKEVISTTGVIKQVVIYRVQLLTTNSSKGSYMITINNKSYNTFEYFYKGAYRTTVGEFKTLSEASALQKSIRQSGYPDAFVVAFKNNERSLDSELFK